VGTGNAVAKEISLSEKLIERGVPVLPEQLVDASVNLKSLLRG
jgi:3-phenylpropionate/trans-cinnamate dioxygenase ferredoxin reductase component